MQMARKASPGRPFKYRCWMLSKKATPGPDPPAGRSLPESSNVPASPPATARHRAPVTSMGVAVVTAGARSRESLTSPQDAPVATARTVYPLGPADREVSALGQPAGEGVVGGGFAQRVGC